MAPELWYGPSTASADYLGSPYGLFTAPQDWATVRRKITAFGITNYNLLPESDQHSGIPAQDAFLHQLAGDNFQEAFIARDAFRALRTLGLQTILGFDISGAAGVTVADNFTRLQGFMNTILNNGGQVDRIDFDTTLGRFRGAYGWSVVADIVAFFKDFCDLVVAAYPTVKLGDTEAFYVAGDGADKNAWVDACLAAGIPLDWLGFDVGWHLGAVATDEVTITVNHCHGLVPPLKVALEITPGQTTAVEPDDGTYAIQAQTAIDRAYAAAPDADIIYVTTWYQRATTSGQRDIPANLPESAAWSSHTWVAAQAATGFAIPDAVRGLEGFSHIDGITAEPLVGLYREAGGLDVEPAGTMYELVTGSGAPVPSYPLLTRIESPAWRGSWRASN